MGQKPRALDPAASPRAFFGAQLRTWRNRLGWSQAHLGDLVHVSGDLISKLEKAERRPVPDLVHRLDSVLRAQGELRAAAAQANRSDAQHFGRGPASAELVPRVDSGGHTTADLVIAARSWSEHTRYEDEGLEDDGTAGERVVAMIRDRTRQLRQLEHVGSGSVFAWTLHDLQWAQHLLGEPRPASDWAAMPGIQRGAAELAQLAGWLACDAGAHSQAAVLWLQGLNAAQAAGDVQLGAFIVSCLSYQALWTGRASAALDLISIARTGARDVPSGGLQALLATREARAHAALGQESACERNLEAASAYLAQAESDLDPEWITWVTPAILEADAGRARLDLGLIRVNHGLTLRAVDDLTRGLALLGRTHPRDRALHLTSLAQAHIANGELYGAAEAVHETLDNMTTGLSRRLHERLGSLAGAFDHSSDAGCRSAGERIRTLLAA